MTTKKILQFFTKRHDLHFSSNCNSSKLWQQHDFNLQTVTSAVLEFRDTDFDLYRFNDPPMTVLLYASSIGLTCHLAFGYKQCVYFSNLMGSYYFF